MKIEMVQGDITSLTGFDVIVNAANRHLTRGGGVCGAIHRAAGPELEEECDSYVQAKGPLAVGAAAMTHAFNLPCDAVIHAVGPVYDPSEPQRCAELLRDAYYNSLELADAGGYESIVFPAISTGIFGYPVEAAARVAIQAVSDFGACYLQVAALCLFDCAAYDVFRRVRTALEYDAFRRAREELRRSTRGEE